MTAWMCPIISHYYTVRQEWDSLSHDLIWWQNAGEWDPLSHDLIWWHNAAAMRSCLMIWYDTMQQQWDPCLMISHDDSAATITHCVPHDLTWRQCSNNYTLCSRWFHMTTVQQQLHLVFPMTSHDDSAATIKPFFPHECVWRQCSNNYTLCSPWFHTMTAFLKHAVPASKERRL